MSVRMMTLVWELTLPDSEKLVLLALADCANDEGHCWPSMKTLSDKCSKSDRTIQACIKMLCTKGHLTRREVLGKGCNYTVHPIVRLGGNEQRHYVYKTTRPDTGEFYIGARSCLTDPANDPYVGSGRWVQWQLGSGVPLQKTILAECESRADLAVAEREAIAEHFDDPLCQNAKRGGLATPEQPAGRRISGAQGATQTPEEISPTPEAASDKPSKNHNKPSYLKGVGLPEGFPAEPYMALVRARKSLRNVPFTEDAARGIVRKCLKLQGEGYDPEKLLWKAVDQGWRTVFANDECKATSLRGNLTPEQLEERARFFESVGKADEADDCRRLANDLRKMAA